MISKSVPQDACFKGTVVCVYTELSAQFWVGAHARVGRFSGPGVASPVRLSVCFANANMERKAALTASELTKPSGPDLI